MKLGYSSFFAANTSPTSLLFDALVASEEASFASFEIKETRIKWVHDNESRISHVILGSSLSPGGQWSSANTPDDNEEKSLSYAEMLSLPGFSFTEFYRSFLASQDSLQSFTRPKRGDIAKYYNEYARKLDLLSSFKLGTVVTNVDFSPEQQVYTVSYQDISTGLNDTLTAKLVVLASGIFEKPVKELSIEPRHCTLFDGSGDYERLIEALRLENNQPFINETHIPIVPPPENFGDITCMEPSLIVPSCPSSPNARAAVLVVGSGVSAAEAVNQCAKFSDMQTIHIFRWSESDPGPLRRFSKETYPEYARVYKLMKQAVKNETVTEVAPDFMSEGSTYQGMPNSCVLGMSACGDVTIQLESGETVTQKVYSIKVCTGRSGSLTFLSPTVRSLAGFTDPKDAPLSINVEAVSKFSLQPYLFHKRRMPPVEDSNAAMNDTPQPALSMVAETSSTSSCCDEFSVASQSKTSSCASSVMCDGEDDDPTCKPCQRVYNLKLCDGMYAVGSLTGETLVRLMLGGCAWVAGDILRSKQKATCNTSV